MRVPLTIVGAFGLAFLVGCTTKSAEPPPLAGPSTLATTITMTADKDILNQNGLDEAVITVQALGPNGEPRNVNLRAEILVDGVPQDYGTLSTKALTTPTVIRYRAPAAPTTVGGQGASTVTIAVTPIGNDFQAAVSRTIEIRLVPPGIILPTNPSLAATFTATPNPSLAFSSVVFDASATTNGGTRCNDACTYSWNFGDGTTGTGMITTHTFRTVGSFQVALTVTDSRGAQTTFIRTQTVNPSTPPTGAIQVSPTPPVGVNQDVFFDASGSRAATGRTIVRYDWNFGDGQFGSGVNVTHRYAAIGTYQVVLTVTDDAGAVSAPVTSSVAVASGAPTVTLTFSPTAPRAGQQVFFTATATTSGGATITGYRFTFGDGAPEEAGQSSNATHVYATAGIYVARVTVTDSLGRTGTGTANVTVTP